MAHEALKGPKPKECFSDIFSQRKSNPDLFITLQGAAYFTPRNPKPFDSVTVPSRLHPSLEEKGVRVEPLMTGGIPKQELLDQFSKLGGISAYARIIVENPAFPISTEQKEIQVVVPRVGDLGIEKNFPTTVERDARCAEVGLERLSGEDFLHYILKYEGSLKPGEVIFAGMESIAGSGGDPGVLYVERDRGGLWLRDDWVEPSNEWLPARRVAFGLRK
jgi:hypothetical protein